MYLYPVSLTLPGLLSDIDWGGGGRVNLVQVIAGDMPLEIGCLFETVWYANGS